jgi:hypothetical protein
MERRAGDPEQTRQSQHGKEAATAMNIAFRMFDDSNASKGIKKAEHVEPSSEQVAMAALMKGVHY